MKTLQTGQTAPSCAASEHAEDIVRGVLVRELKSFCVALPFIFGVLIVMGAADSRLSVLQILQWGLFGLFLMTLSGVLNWLWFDEQ